MRPVIEALKAGKPARTAAPAPTEKDACKEYKMLQLLTAKPVLYVATLMKIPPLRAINFQIWL